MIYVTNAFSIQMLDRENTDPLGRDLTFCPASLGAVQDMLREEPWTGAVGHADTAAIVAEQIGEPVERVHARVSVALQAGDTLLVAQYRGPRLPEGATMLPEGAAIEWWVVS